MDTQEKIRKIDAALEALSIQESDCRLCPRECGVNRKEGETGYCGSSASASVSHALLHYGEEPVLSGIRGGLSKETLKKQPRQGSGTIFFSGCNLKCLFCQNYQISWLHQGKELHEDSLTRTMLELQRQGALNINLVSPTHVLLPILKALRSALTQGLNLPIVYNSNGYEKSRILRNFEGIVDIFLPDLKYHSSALSDKLSGRSDYFRMASQAITEMYCQQPVLKLNQSGKAEQGLIVRHLVLPGQAHDSQQILLWMKRHLSLSIGLSLMSQYYPCYKAPPEFQRTLISEEYHRVLKFSENLGFEHIFAQPEPFSQGENLIPDFGRKDPFKWS